MESATKKDVIFPAILTLNRCLSGCDKHGPPTGDRHCKMKQTKKYPSVVEAGFRGWGTEDDWWWASTGSSAKR